MNQAGILDAKLAEYPTDPLTFRGPIRKNAILGFCTRAGHFVLFAALASDKAAENECTVSGRGSVVNHRPDKISIGVDLDGQIRASRKQQTFPGAALQVRENPIGRLTMDLMWRMHKLAEKIHSKTDIWPSVRKVQELAHQLLVLMMVHRR